MTASTGFLPTAGLNAWLLGAGTSRREVLKVKSGASPRLCYIGGFTRTRDLRVRARVIAAKQRIHRSVAHTRRAKHGLTVAAQELCSQTGHVAHRCLRQCRP